LEDIEFKKNVYCYCEEIDEKSACETVILALLGFFTQQVIPFVEGTQAYIEEIDNEHQSSIAVTRERKRSQDQ